MPESKTFRLIKRNVGKAIRRYGMISDGDGIVVGLSGGKDSLTLLWLLRALSLKAPVNFKLFPVYVDPGFENGFAEELAAHCAEENYNLRIERTDFGIKAHSEENRENPCFLCSRLRRKRLFEIVAELGCQKLALGHHKDDIIETLFLNIFYSGEISSMQPVQPLFGDTLAIIRPLAFTDENFIARFAREKGFPKFPNPCPSATTSKRSMIKEMLNQLYKSNKKIKGNIFRAMRNVNTDYLLK